MANIDSVWYDLVSATGNITKSFKWRTREFWWSGKFSIIGTAIDLFGIATNIASWIQSGSQTHT